MQLLLFFAYKPFWNTLLWERINLKSSWDKQAKRKDTEWQNNRKANIKEIFKIPLRKVENYKWVNAYLYLCLLNSIKILLLHYFFLNAIKLWNCAVMKDEVFQKIIANKCERLNSDLYLVLKGFKKDARNRLNGNN